MPAYFKHKLLVAIIPVNKRDNGNTYEYDNSKYTLLINIFYIIIITFLTVSLVYGLPLGNLIYVGNHFDKLLRVA